MQGESSSAKPQSRIGRAEIGAGVALCLAIGAASLVLKPEWITFTPFRSLVVYWAWVVCGLVMVASCWRVKGARILFQILTLLVTAAAVHWSGRALEAKPASAKLPGHRFDKAPLGEVLQAVAKESGTRPKWVFQVCERSLRTTRLTVEWPEGASLKEVLQKIGQATGTKFVWRFRSEEESKSIWPEATEFLFWPEGQPVPRQISELYCQNSTGLVTAEKIWYRGEIETGPVLKKGKK